MKVSKIEDFVRISTAHSAICAKQLVLIERDTMRGAFIRQTWKCPCCKVELHLDNCDMIKSSEVAEGASHSRKQPDFNLRILKGALLSGINITKMQEFVEGHKGIKIARMNNLRLQ